MKQVLLTGAVLLSGVFSAMALPEAPQVYPDQNITRISPNGVYVVSDMYGSIIITNRETGEEFMYLEGEPTYLSSYGTGIGNCWSNDGILVGCTDGNGDPAYWENGEWKQMPNPDGRSVWMEAISADGTVATALLGILPSDNLPSDLLNIPAVYYRQADGTWSDPEILPYPIYDFTGRVAQRITAATISDDGRIIVGQFLDYSGVFPEPIRFTRDSDGKWSYDLFASKLLNPEGRAFPEYPEVAPQMPEPVNYISDPEKRKEYEDAYNAWIESGYSLPYPDAADYLSDADREAYNAAVEKYNVEAEAYNTKLMAFFDVFDLMYEESAMLVYNNVLLTGNGATAVMSNQRAVVVDPTDPWGGTEEYTEPIVFNLLNDEYKSFPLEGVSNLLASSIANDGTILAYSNEANRHSFIMRPEGLWTPLYDFLVASTDEQYHDWLKENLTHTFESMDWMTGETVSYTDEPLMGIPVCTPDLSVITAVAENSWDFEDETWIYSYVIPTSKATLGVGSIKADKVSLNVVAAKGGLVTVEGEADVDVYDLQGRLVFSASQVSGTINTGLNGGVYVVKATADEAVRTVKAVF